MMFFLPLKMFISAASGPERSVPASGCEATNRRLILCDLTALQISFFVDPHYHHSIQKKRCYDLHNSIILTIGEHTFIATELTAIILLLNNQELIETGDYRYSLGWDDKDSCLKSNLYDFYLPALSNDSIEEFNYTVEKYPVWGRMVEIE